MTLAANGQFGRLAFDATGTTDGYESVTGRFDFRANGGANAGDISNNSIYVAFDGATVAQIQAPFDISTAAFHRALFDLEFVAGGALLDLSLVEDVNGAPGSLQSIFDDLFIAGAVPYDFRAGFAGRTGGLNADQGIDNVFIEVTSIPEPASAFLLTVGLAGLVARRRRRCAA